MNEFYLTHFSALFSFVLYLVASLAFLFWGMARSEKLGRAGTLITFVAFGFHTLALVLLLFDERSPFSGNLGDYLFSLSWGIVLLYLMAQRKRHYAMLGAFVVPSVCLIIASSSWLVHLSHGVKLESGTGLLLLLHVLPALISEVSLLFALLISALFLVQERKLKRHAVDAVTLSGPSLSFLDDWNSRLVWVGFLTMSLAILSGSVWAVSTHQTLLGNDYRQLSALLSWVILALILHLRVGQHWPSRKLSKITLLGGTLVIVGYVVFVSYGGQVLHAL